MKLDSFSKIQIATFGIQYMASSIQQLKMGAAAAGIDILDGYDEMLADIEKKLTKIYEQTADLLNSQDAVCAIDVNILQRPSDILLFGMDDTEHDYYSDPICPGCGACSKTITARPDFDGPEICDNCYDLSKMRG